MSPIGRVIVGFHLDPQGDWVAELACGHGQHVRHRPPWESRPWVESEGGREAHLGEELPCPSCQMPALPEGLELYRQTPDFDERSLPDGLRRSHTLKAGSWGRIVVLEGRLLYVIEREPVVAFALGPELPGIIEPEAPHHVEPRGHVRFRIEFHRRLPSGSQ